MGPGGKGDRATNALRLRLASLPTSWGGDVRRMPACLVPKTSPGTLLPPLLSPGESLDGLLIPWL